MTKLKEKRTEKGIKGAELARRLGISRSCVNIAEKKGIRNAATAARYANVLNCRPEEIMEFDIISTKGETR